MRSPGHRDLHEHERTWIPGSGTAQDTVDAGQKGRAHSVGIAKPSGRRPIASRHGLCALASEREKRHATAEGFCGPRRRTVDLERAERSTSQRADRTDGARLPDDSSKLVDISPEEEAQIADKILNR